jgi:hypothetical protein
MVSVHATALLEGTWTPPANLHDKVVTARPVGHIFNTITNGIRNMPPYGPQITVEDRWAIVLYVKALQRSQAASLNDVTEPAQRQQLEDRRMGEIQREELEAQRAKEAAEAAKKQAAQEAAKAKADAAAKGGAPAAPPATDTNATAPPATPQGEQPGEETK